jgi:hypothetical protein
MTAINVFIAADAAHIFTDGGNYDAGSLEFRHLGGKLFHLPQYGAALAWSGPSSLGPKLVPAIGGSGASGLTALCSILPPIVASIGRDDPHSVIIAGAGVGMTVEEGGRASFLTVGGYLKTIPSAMRFDKADIRGSGLAMMCDQRSSGVVHGFCLYTRVSRDRMISEVIERWPR